MNLNANVVQCSLAALKRAAVKSALKVFKLAFAAENNELARQMEEVENKGSHLSRTKTLLMSQHEDLKKQFDEEVKVSVLDPCSGDEGPAALRVTCWCVCALRLKRR